MGLSRARLRGIALAAVLALAGCASQQNGAAEITPPASTAAAPAILVYSATGAFRHDNLAASNAAIADIARDRGWRATFTDDPNAFTPQRLASVEAVVWNNATGDTLSPEGKAAFRAFIENGGGYVGLHAAGDSSHTWPWYAEELIGATFIGHSSPQNPQQAEIRIEQPGHHAMRDLPARWARRDEWYSFDRSVRGRFSVLASLNESSYAPDEGRQEGSRSLVMGDHPIVWHRCLGEGRAFYSALGHHAEAYAEPAHRSMIAGAIEWALGAGDCPQ